MRRLCSLLGMPQHRFASIHVVGTNGKTSVTRMAAALLEAHGVRAGAYLSPHILSWRERILVGGEPISEQAFGAAIERAEQAAQIADRSAGEEGPVSQFELSTAAAFLALASARVEAAVIEAGLGGRLDATNVIPSKVTVLTSVGLDHTEWLGGTIEEIAAEKLAVLRDHTTLVHGEVPAEVEPVIEEAVERAHAGVVRPAESPPAPASDLVPSGYQTGNLGLAIAAVEAFLGSFDTDVLASGAASGLAVPGRADLVPGEPPLIFDAAHNPDGARALAAALPQLAGGRPVVCCLAVLEDKDAAGIVRGLADACSRFVCTEVPEAEIEGSGRPGGRSRSAESLTALCREAGAEAEAVATPDHAWRRARELALGAGGVALAAGSHYLLGCLWTERPAPTC